MYRDMLHLERRMHKTTRLKICDLNPHILCVLCGGYFVDATTIIECLHSFCRSCITKYLEGSKCCPICDVQVHKTRPTVNLRQDRTLQTLVYKLVPDMYKHEMQRRREFYKEHPDAVPSASAPNAIEEKGEADDDRYRIHEDTETISVVLQHCCRLPLPSNDIRKRRHSQSNQQAISDRRNLLCPSGVSMALLKKFLRCKFDIKEDYQVDIFYLGDEVIPEDYTLADVAYVYGWSRADPMKLFYIVLDKREVCINLPGPASLAPIVMDEPQTKVGKLDLDVASVDTEDTPQLPVETSPMASDESPASCRSTSFNTSTEHSQKHAHKKKKKKKKKKRSRSSRNDEESPDKPREVNGEVEEEIRSVIMVRIPKDKIYSPSAEVNEDSYVCDESDADTILNYDIVDDSNKQYDNDKSVGAICDDDSVVILSDDDSTTDLPSKTPAAETGSKVPAIVVPMSGVESTIHLKCPVLKLRISQDATSIISNGNCSFTSNDDMDSDTQEDESEQDISSQSDQVVTTCDDQSSESLDRLSDSEEAKPASVIVNVLGDVPCSVDNNTTDLASGVVIEENAPLIIVVDADTGVCSEPMDISSNQNVSVLREYENISDESSNDSCKDDKPADNVDKEKSEDSGHCSDEDTEDPKPISVRPSSTDPVVLKTSDCQSTTTSSSTEKFSFDPKITVLSCPDATQEKTNRNGNQTIHGQVNGMKSVHSFSEILSQVSRTKSLVSSTCTKAQNTSTMTGPLPGASRSYNLPNVDVTCATVTATPPKRTKTGVHSSLSPPEKLTLNESNKLPVRVPAHGAFSSPLVRRGPQAASSSATSLPGDRCMTGPYTHMTERVQSDHLRSHTRGPLKERPLTLPVLRTTPPKPCSSLPKHPYPGYYLDYHHHHVHPSLSAISALALQQHVHPSRDSSHMKQLNLLCGDMGLSSHIPVHPFTGSRYSAPYLATGRQFLSPIFSPPLPVRSIPSPLSPARASPLSPNHFAQLPPAHFGPMSPPRVNHLSPPIVPGGIISNHGNHVPGYDSPLELTTRKSKDLYSKVGNSDQTKTGADK